jgi:hypothetical protein
MPVLSEAGHRRLRTRSLLPADRRAPASPPRALAREAGHDVTAPDDLRWSGPCRQAAASRRGFSSLHRGCKSDAGRLPNVRGQAEVWRPPRHHSSSSTAVTCSATGLASVRPEKAAPRYPREAGAHRRSPTCVSRHEGRSGLYLECANLAAILPLFQLGALRRERLSRPAASVSSLAHVCRGAFSDVWWAAGPPRSGWPWSARCSLSRSRGS